MPANEAREDSFRHVFRGATVFFRGVTVQPVESKRPKRDYWLLAATIVLEIAWLALLVTLAVMR